MLKTITFITFSMLMPEKKYSSRTSLFLPLLFSLLRILTKQTNLPLLYYYYYYYFNNYSKLATLSPLLSFPLFSSSFCFSLFPLIVASLFSKSFLAYNYLSYPSNIPPIPKLIAVNNPFLIFSSVAYSGNSIEKKHV